LSLIITKKYYSNSDKENGTSVWLQPLLDAWLGNRFAWWPRWPLSRRLGRLPCLAAASMKRSFMDAMIEWFDEDDAERKIITQLRSHLAQGFELCSHATGLDFCLEPWARNTLLAADDGQEIRFRLTAVTKEQKAQAARRLNQSLL